MKLTQSQSRYLIALYKLSDHEKGVRSKGIAEALNVSRPSVNRMLNNLGNMGLLEKRLYGNVFLTEAGKELAEEHYQEIKRLGNQLEACLAIPSDVAEKCALLIISELSQNI